MPAGSATAQSILGMNIREKRAGQEPSDLVRSARGPYCAWRPAGARL